MSFTVFENVENHVLGIDDFNKVFIECEQFCADWRKIAVHLDISKQKVNIIEVNNKDVNERFSELIAVWLKRERPEQPLPTWRVMCKAIASVDRGSAEEIAKVHQCDCDKCTGHQDPPKTHPHVSEPPKPGKSESSKLESPDIETRIWTAGEAGAEVVEACVRKLQNGELFPDDKKLMRRIAFIMSRDGNPPIQLRNDGGIWQVSHFAFDDTKDPAHIRLPIKYRNLQGALKIKHWSDVTRTDLEIPMYSAIAARLYLSNYCEGIPPSYDIKRQTKYWWNLYMKNHEALPIMSEQDFVNSVRILEE